MREARLIGVTTSSVTAAREVVGCAVRLRFVHLLD